MPRVRRTRRRLPARRRHRRSMEYVGSSHADPRRLVDPPQRAERDVHGPQRVVAAASAAPRLDVGLELSRGSAWHGDRVGGSGRGRCPGCDARRDQRRVSQGQQRPRGGGRGRGRSRQPRRRALRGRQRLQHAASTAESHRVGRALEAQARLVGRFDADSLERRSGRSELLRRHGNHRPRHAALQASRGRRRGSTLCPVAVPSRSRREDRGGPRSPSKRGPPSARIRHGRVGGPRPRGNGGSPYQRCGAVSGRRVRGDGGFRQPVLGLEHRGPELRAAVRVGPRHRASVLLLRGRGL
mmetsp:Transcript_12662/g.43172  ORF Transcript_12662/g.43172 Transcript_12662/m.43172 type:complete len:297 (+) Transcript_12662:11655-12545(+)